MTPEEAQQQEAIRQAIERIKNQAVQGQMPGQPAQPMQPAPQDPSMQPQPPAPAPNDPSITMQQDPQNLMDALKRKRESELMKSLFPEGVERQ